MYALDSSVRQGFSRAKEDIETLRQENKELRAMIREMQYRLDNQPASPVIPEAQQIAVNGNLKSALKEVLREMNVYQQHQSPASRQEDDSVARFGIDKKTLIKAKILEAVDHAPIALPRLKELMVDQQRYCSKASFYRYFEELKREEKVSLIEVNGRSVVRSAVEVYT